MAANLPWELIEDILRRLPVKSLKRFRAVAKSWCFVIDSEKFIKSHLNWSLITKSHRRLLLSGLGLYSIDLESLDEAHVVKTPFYYKTVDEISSCCNGLVLVHSEPPVLWNPFSRDYKILPGVRPLDSDTKAIYGFGYDSKIDDYKVVRIVELRNENTLTGISSRTEIYSLKSNSWKRIDNFTYPMPFLMKNWLVHINGSLHTLKEDNGTAKIMAFSLETEKHTELMFPSGIRLHGAGVMLDVLAGCLTIVCTRRSGSDVWVMKEYGVRESWTKLLVIGRGLESHMNLRPLVYSKDGRKVLLNCDDKRLVWFDLSEKTVEEVSVEGIPFVFYAEVCVESLVSFHEPDEVRKLGNGKKKGKRISNNKRDAFLSEGFKLVL